MTKAVTVRTPFLDLSGITSTPSATPPRGLILALHGGGYACGYWDCPAEGGRHSLLKLGAELGFHVLAVDRPGYGAAKAFDPSRLDLNSQVSFLFDAIDSWSAEQRFDGPAFVIGHSIGGILALLMAADPRSARLGGVDALGVPLAFPDSEAGNEVTSWSTPSTHMEALTEEMRRVFCFGPDDTFSPEAFEYDRTLIRPMPVAEHRDAIAIPDMWPRILPTVTTPVQLTMAELEVMQVTGPDALRRAQTLLSNSAYARFHLQPATGHNASMHHIARAYHLRAIAFFEECIALRRHT